MQTVHVIKLLIDAPRVFHKIVKEESFLPWEAKALDGLELPDLANYPPRNKFKFSNSSFLIEKIATNQFVLEVIVTFRGICITYWGNISTCRGRCVTFRGMLPRISAAYAICPGYLHTRVTAATVTERGVPSKSMIVIFWGRSIRIVTFRGSDTGDIRGLHRIAINSTVRRFAPRSSVGASFIASHG
jgi:hypothetical protein